MEETPEATKDEDFPPPETKIPKKKIQLMDQAQAHSADKKAISNRGLAEVLSNDANKVNNNAEDLTVKTISKSQVHCTRVKNREQKLQETEEKVNSACGPFHLMFDGKKIDDWERMVVVVQYLNKNHQPCEKFLRFKSFLKEESITGECLFEAMVKDLFDKSFLR